MYVIHPHNGILCTPLKESIRAPPLTRRDLGKQAKWIEKQRTDFSENHDVLQGKSEKRLQGWGHTGTF